MAFRIAQTFYVDSSAVQNVLEVGITGVDLYFKSTPHPTKNKSNIKYPGVEIYLVNTKNSVPMLAGLISNSTAKARVDFSDIRASKTASIPTRFKFSAPVLVKTGKEYAIIIKYDGNEDFELWSSKQGDLLLGTTKVSPGPSGKYVGNYYNYTNVSANSADPWDSLVSNNIQSDSELAKRWKPIKDTDLKFKIYVARYYKSGVAVDDPLTINTLGGNSTGTGAARFLLDRGDYEYVLYDKKYSKDASLYGGDKVFQISPYYPGGYSNASATQYAKISVTANSYLVTANGTLPNGSAFNWNNIYTFNGDEYIVINSNNHPTIASQFIVRKVDSLISNSVLRVTRKIHITNSSARFFKSPVGELGTIGTTKLFGNIASFMILTDSNANSTVRFVNNSVYSITINSGGSGYANTDTLSINGYENVGVEVTGGYAAKANLVTNSTGGITSLYLSNLGCGFTNTEWLAGSNIAFANSTSGSSNGTNANLSITIGSRLQTEHGGNGGYFSNVQIVNLEVAKFSGKVEVSTPSGTSYKMYHQFPYYALPSSNTISGVAYYVTENDNTNRSEIRNNVLHKLNLENIPVIPSRSNQFIITNGTNVLSTPKPSTNTTVDATSNNDFTCVSIPRESKFVYASHIINNDYSGENHDSGNAFAKHITEQIKIGNNALAEDILVYLTAHRPANTDIKVFARIHNSNDPEAFEDKDWTLLEMKGGKDNTYCNPDNDNDLKEYTFGFSLSPNTVSRLDGTVSITDISNTSLSGSGTTWAANAAIVLQPDDLIRISSPLFPNNYVISVVDTVTDNTTITIKDGVGNNNVVGDGLVIDFVGRIGNNSTANVGYPLQAFNNITNDNVARYYTSNMVEYDGYDTFQLKIVLLADQVSNDSIQVYPSVDYIYAYGVSS